VLYCVIVSVSSHGVHALAQEGPPLVCLSLEGGCVGVGVGKELQGSHVAVQAVHRVLVVPTNAQVAAGQAGRQTGQYKKSVNTQAEN